MTGGFGGREGFFTRLINTFRGSALRVGTAQAPAQGSATSDDGAPTTSKHKEAFVSPTRLESNLTANLTEPRAGMTHLLRVSGSYSGSSSISSGEGADAPAPAPSPEE